MDFDLTDDQRTWLREVREFLSANVTTALTEELWEHGRESDGPHTRTFRARVAEQGWYGLNWPAEYGGRGRGAVDQFLLINELETRGIPALLVLPVAVTTIGPTILRFGTDENRRMWLPRIVRGEVSMALGYSEPDAGTDLASLRTRGEPHGHHWVVTGQKLWTSEAHTATHLWLAARTGPTSPKHSGISLFVVDMDSPGITVRSLRTWSDLRTNEVFLDAVRIPRENLIGEADKGWRYITAALGFERVMTAAFVASARRDFDQLVSYSRDTVVDGQPILQRPGVRRRLAELDRDLELGWLLGLQTAAAIDRGDVPMAEAAMLKVYGSDLQSRVARAGTEILGPAGQLDRHDPHAPLRGAMEWLYRQAPLMRFAAGANEIQRDIIGRAAGLPESRAGVASGRGAR